MTDDTRCRAVCLNRISNEPKMALFAQCDACKLAREIVPCSTLCSGCRHNNAVINTCTRAIANLENVIAGLAALLFEAAAAQREDSASRRKLEAILSELVILQGRTHNTGLTDDVQAIIESIES
jgi:hypothetical protein